MRIVGLDGDLPALPGAGIDAHRLQSDGEKTGGDLFARGDDGVIFARVVERRIRAGDLRHVLHPVDQLVGLAGHGRDDDRHLVAGIDLAFDMPGNVVDAFEIGDGGTAEFHHDASHAFDTVTLMDTRRRPFGEPPETV